MSRNGTFGGKVVVSSAAGDAVAITGKAKSASTVAADPGTTLVTKDYITSTSGGGNTGQFGYWTRNATTSTLSMVNGGDTCFSWRWTGRCMGTSISTVVSSKLIR